MISPSVPAPSIPPEIYGYLSEIGGLTLRGQPRFRLVWSEDRRTPCLGNWEDYSPQGIFLRQVREVRQVKKYPAIRNRWIIERWWPAILYGAPNKWDEKFGPYPSEGEYEWVDTVESVGACECDKPLTWRMINGRQTVIPCSDCHRDSKYMEPTRAYLDHLIKLVKKAEDATVSQYFASEQEDPAVQEAQSRASAERYLDEARDAISFHGRPFVVVPRGKEQIQ